MNPGPNSPTLSRDARTATWHSLGYAGLLPFALPLLASLLGLSPPGWPPSQVFFGYSLAIACFLFGSLWGRCLTLPARDGNRRVLIASNLGLLLVVAIAPRGATPIALVLLVCCYLAIWWLERHYLAIDSQPRGYAQLRSRLTLAVIAMHLVLLAHVSG